MPAAPTTGRVVYRNPVSLWLLTASAAFLVVAGWRVGGGARPLLIGLGVVAAAAAWWPRVVVDDEGLTLVGLRYHWLPWSEISAITAADGPWWWQHDVLQVSTHGGRVHRSAAVGISPSTTFPDARGTRNELIKRRHRLFPGEKKAKTARPRRRR